jgi:hypothetical protein
MLLGARHQLGRGARVRDILLPCTDSLVAKHSQRRVRLSLADSVNVCECVFYTVYATVKASSR